VGLQHFAISQTTHYVFDDVFSKNMIQLADFTSNRLFMKLFRTGSIDVIQECRSYFGVELPSCLIKKRQDKFLTRYNCVENLFCRYCSKL